MFQEATSHDASHHEIKHNSSGDSGSAGVVGLSFDWKTLKHKRDAYIKRLNNIYLSGLQSAGVEVVDRGWTQLTAIAIECS